MTEQADRPTRIETFEAVLRFWDDDSLAPQWPTDRRNKLLLAFLASMGENRFADLRVNQRRELVHMISVILKGHYGRP